MTVCLEIYRKVLDMAMEMSFNISFSQRHSPKLFLGCATTGEAQVALDFGGQPDFLLEREGDP